MGSNISDLACSWSRTLEEEDSGSGMSESLASEVVSVSSSTVADKKRDLVVVLLPCPIENAEEHEMLRVTSAASQTRLWEKIIFCKVLKRMFGVIRGPREGKESKLG